MFGDDERCACDDIGGMGCPVHRASAPTRPPQTLTPEARRRRDALMERYRLHIPPPAGMRAPAPGMSEKHRDQIVDSLQKLATMVEGEDQTPAVVESVLGFRSVDGQSVTLLITVRDPEQFLRRYTDIEGFFTVDASAGDFTGVKSEIAEHIAQKMLAAHHELKEREEREAGERAAAMTEGR